MAVRIRQLVSDVTVQRTPASAPISSQDSAHTSGELPAPEQVSVDLPTPPVTYRPELSSPKRAKKTSRPQIDPRDLADRVYQMMREELRIARERQ